MSHASGAAKPRDGSLGHSPSREGSRSRDPVDYHRQCAQLHDLLAHRQSPSRVYAHVRATVCALQPLACSAPTPIRPTAHAHGAHARGSPPPPTASTPCYGIVPAPYGYICDGTPPAALLGPLHAHQERVPTRPLSPYSARARSSSGASEKSPRPAIFINRTVHLSMGRIPISGSDTDADSSPSYGCNALPRYQHLTSLSPHAAHQGVSGKDTLNCSPARNRAAHLKYGTQMISLGLEPWAGYFQSIRPSMGRILINVDISMTAITLMDSQPTPYEPFSSVD
ncbi:hypothetical protein FIBSPDRAFT_947099 [Athelia psychrophila]|uniref:Argonaute linker 1 domain-containing protein n=1 Tax=Athelia psychrophila TaxID=1759441 RepID=A0A166S767_9AGAM|nr:hypothetical protein FIBSPDRAFT_947099 [Fibularhizoctonia sp. CBS 109695]